jgi:hypothetical protein
MQSDIETWLDSISGSGWVWYARRLSGNDSGATKSHQYGIYIPKPVLWSIFPSTRVGSNPDAEFSAHIMPYDETRTLRGVWYNGESRNESRITRWNKPRPILEPDLTGAICLFAFRQRDLGQNAEEGAIWICQNEAEESSIESRLGEIQPGEGIVHHPAGILGELATPLFAPVRKSCFLDDAEIPPEWLVEFPTGQVLVERALAMMPATRERPDTRLITRRECETALFYSVEQACVLPRIREGFVGVNEFVDFANSVTNRRKSRAGKSLELHLKAIFKEESLTFAHGEKSEGDKRPDFLFPSIAAYHDARRPEAKLRMLAAKTTCKDRWRQILNEANRIHPKHLVTLQQGVSENQFREMSDEGVVLVVPQALHKSFPEVVKPHLMNLERFIAETRIACE